MPFGACWVSIERAEHITQLAIFTPLPSSASFWVDQLRRRGGGLEQQNTSSSQHFFHFRALPAVCPGEEGERAIVAKREPMRHISLGRRVGGVVVLAKARTAYVLSLS
jgi:hypothetical protein